MPAGRDRRAEDGTKEQLAVEDDYRESTESWAAVMRDLKNRGLSEPRLVIGDGALGICAALRDVFPGARRQACCVHAIARVLDALPKRCSPGPRALLREIMEAPTRSDARQALERSAGRRREVCGPPTTLRAQVGSD